jgi:hypothetical protein
MMQNSTMSDMIRQMMEKKKESPQQEGGGTLVGQFASTVRMDQMPNGESREFVWVNKNEELDYDAPDQVWEDTPGSFKVYGNWNEYAQGQDEEGNMFIPDEDFPYVRNEEGNFVLDESTLDGQMRGTEAGRNLGGPGASKMEDLMEKLGQMRGPGGQPAPGRKMAMGGKIYRRGGKFPDLTGDGKVTFADILKGRGVGR